MNPIRVHLGPMPRMLRSMISDLLASEPDMTVVGNSFDAQESLHEASAQSADILIEQERAANHRTCTAAVLSGAPAAILAVATDGHDGMAVNFVRQPISLNCEGSLPNAVRQLLGGSACLVVRNHD